MNMAKVKQALVMSAKEIAKSIVTTRLPHYIEGDTGASKTTSVAQYIKEMTGKDVSIFDCANKTEGDFGLYNFDMGNRTSTLFANSELSGGQTHINFDELPKAIPNIKKSVIVVAQERRIGDYKLPDDVLIYATGNLSNEGLGDFLDAHERNRWVVVRMRKPTSQEWIEDYAIPNGISAETIAFVDQTPKLGESFTDLDNMGFSDLKERKAHNSMIYDPRLPSDDAFATWRSITKADAIVKNREILGSNGTRVALAGTIGLSATNELMTFLTMADKLPPMSEILKNPDDAMLVGEGASSCMLLHKMRENTKVLTQDNKINPIESGKRASTFIKYLKRMKPDYQAQYLRAVGSDKSISQIYFKNPDFGKLAVEYNFIFQADK